jgi:signal transduction histidine kinase
MTQPWPRLPQIAWLWLVCVLLAGVAPRVAAAETAQTFTHAETAPAGWQADAPPATGWTPATLPDDWSHRWPRHDGVVWYRIRWNQTDASQPVGLLLNQVILANAVYVNGSLIHRDPHLVEPLSRSWIKPQYFVLSGPLLRAGENTLLVRVSGLAHYQPGLGRVTVGPPQAVYAMYHAGWMLRYQFRLYNQAVFLAMGLVFGVLWLFRRRDTLYGWFSASTLLIAAFDWNNVASSTWPFTSTDAFQSWNMVFYVAGTVALAVFLLRFCARRWPRIEGALWLYVAANVLVAVIDPHLLGVWRFKLAPVDVALYFAVPLVFIGYAARRRQADMLVLAACLLLPLLAMLHDVLRFFEILQDRAYVAALTAPFTLLGMSVVLAHRYAAAMRRAEYFNVELQREVDAATARLSATMGREHQLELAHSQVNARLNLVRDLHDGFGGSLVAAIAALERAPDAAANVRGIETLKELRDDLRLVIGTTTRAADADLEALLAPLLHRWDQRMEAAGIESDFSTHALADLRLVPARSLDLLRFLQEALTNVLKHSRARHATLDIRHAAEHLCVELRDDGCGFDPASPSTPCGAGLTSLRARAARLGAAMVLDGAPGSGVTLRLEIPVAGES